MAPTTRPPLEEQVLELLREQCSLESHGTCMTLGCLLNGGWRLGDHASLKNVRPTCAAHELAKAWRKVHGSENNCQAE